MMTQYAIGLFLASIAYTLLLVFLRHLWEPHFTWMEVAVGVALCLSAPYLSARYGTPPADWAAYETAVWQAFLIGGAPIIFWQLSQSVRVWLRVERRIGSRHANSRDTADRADALAAPRRRGPHDDD